MKDWSKLVSSDSESESDEEPVEKPKEKKELPVQKEVIAPVTKSNEQAKKSNWMTDDELIEAVGKNKRGPWCLKVVYCFDLDTEKLKEKFPMSSNIHNYREGSYDIQFTNQENCLLFLEEKKKNNYRFRIKNIEEQRHRPPKHEQARQKPSEEKGEYAFEKKRQDPPTNRHRDQEEHKKKTVVEHIFKQENKLFFNNTNKLAEQLTAEKITKEINERKMFTQFSSIVLVVNEESNQLYDQVRKIGQEIAKSLNRIFKEDKFGSHKAFKILQTEPVVEKPIEAEYTFQKKKKEENKESHKDHISRAFNKNTILFRRQEFTHKQILAEVQQRRLFDEFGNVRVKCFKNDKAQAKQLAQYIADQTGREIVATQSFEDKMFFAIGHQSKKHIKQKAHVDTSYIENKDNKIKISENINIEAAVEEARKKLPQILKEFDGVCVEFSVDQTTAANELMRVLKEKLTLVEGPRRNLNNLTRITLVEGKKVESDKKDQNSDLIDAKKDSWIMITTKFDPNKLYAQFQKKKDLIFQLYNCFRLKTEQKDLFDFTSKLGEHLSEKHDLIVREAQANIQNGTRLEVMLRKKQTNKQQQNVTERINQYLDN